MRLEQITTDPKRFQFRSQPFSEKTVAAIIQEGIDLAKYEPIPVVREGRGPKVIVAGDGHSRFEAIKQLAAINRLPKAWRIDDTWDIPVRTLQLSEALRLSYTANMSRDPFTAVEQARIFQARLDAGEKIQQIATTSHTTPAQITRTLSLNELCADIQEVVEAPADACGIDRLTAQVLATGFKKYGVTPDQQRDLWHKAMKHAGLNFQSAKRFIDSIGRQLGKRGGAGKDELMFDLPANVTAVLSDAQARVAAYRKARTGVCMLVSAAAEGGLDDYPELLDWIRKHGERAGDALGERLTEDGEVLARFLRRKAG